MSTFRRDPRAFTMIELIVVIVILGVLAALGVSSYRSIQQRAAERALDSSLMATHRNAQAQAVAQGGELLNYARPALAELPPQVFGAVSHAGSSILLTRSSDRGKDGSVVRRLTIDPTNGATSAGPGATPSLYSSLLAADGAVNLYRFDGDVTDALGSADGYQYFPGTSPFAAGVVAGEDDRALDFAGFNGFGATVRSGAPGPGQTGYDVGNTYSVEVWLKATPEPSVLYRSYLGAGSGTSRWFIQQDAGTTGLQIRVDTSAGAGQIPVLIPAVLDGAWHHIVVEFTRSTSTVRAFRDGTLVATGTHAGVLDVQDGVIFGEVQGREAFDEIALYPNGFTPETARAHYRAALRITTP